MFGHGANTGWTALGESVEQLEPGSQAGFAELRRAAEKLPDGESSALAGLLTDQVRQRLEIMADRVSEPGIAREVIERPIVIIGMPRSGTSLLHALLTADPANRAPRSWELMTPSPPAPDAAEVARRQQRAAIAVRAFIAATPDILKVHPYWDEGGNAAVECEDIMQLSLVSPYVPAFFDIPEYDRWLATADHSAAYRAHHEFLQQLQWRAPSRRWVLKGVAHVEHLDLLLDTYPDACLVWPHRDPVKQIASMCAIIAITRRASDPAELNAIYRYLVENAARGLDAALAHPASNDGRIIHVPFARLNHEPAQVVAEVYARLDRPISPEHSNAMAQWLATPQNDAQRHGRVDMDLARFGGSAGELTRRFEKYLNSGLVEVSA